MKTLTKLSALVLATASFAASAAIPAWLKAAPTYSFENDGYTIEEVNKHTYSAALCLEVLCENGSQAYVSAYHFREFMITNQIGYPGNSIRLAQREARELRNLLHHGKKFEFNQRVSNFADDFDAALFFWDEVDYSLSEGAELEDLMYQRIDNPFETIVGVDVNNEYALLDSFLADIRNYGTDEQRERVWLLGKRFSDTGPRSDVIAERKASSDLSQWWQKTANRYRSDLPRNDDRLNNLKDKDYYRKLSKTKPEAFEAHVLPFFDRVLDATETIVENKYQEFLAGYIAEEQTAIM